MSRIKYLCPSCQNETLVVDDAGFLVCSWAKCEDPGVIHLIIKHGLEPKPPASEGVREAFEIDLEIEEIESNHIKQEHQPEDNCHCGRDIVWLRDKFVKIRDQALAALPELEKRLCWRLRIDGESKHPKDCYECNGHGEVWVRKAGV